ncbi:AAA family ATPase [Chondromyces apiculatus]|uniref:ORC1/DEAH AAA+ ATPase domain-containing protein n=1 Tax=Chondromyces apiculatus DSM 436 TaxID=1192034 RepID=A0A017T1C4_9BACT|nr:AAA family ATPase [Chondromyces apiculatus]EYF03018.1 Hypothetical protein CAP_6281 [Chondromyces apiculatus DSM 436]
MPLRRVGRGRSGAILFALVATLSMLVASPSSVLARAPIEPSAAPPAAASPGAVPIEAPAAAPEAPLAAPGAPEPAAAAAPAAAPLAVPATAQPEAPGAASADAPAAEPPATAAEAPSSEERKTRIAALAAEAKDVAHGEPAGALLQRVMDELETLRPEVDAALGEGRAAEEAANAGKTRLAEALRDEETLDATRVHLLARLNEEQREEAFGIDRAGMEQLRAEVWHLQARAQGYVLQRERIAGEALAWIRDPFQLAALSVRALLVLVVVVVVLVLASRRQRFLDRTRDVLHRVISRPRLQRWVTGAHTAVSAISGPLLFLVVVWGVHAALGPAAARVREVELGFTLLRWYALYRLGVAIAHQFVASRVGTPELPLGEAISKKIFHSLRTVGRYALFTALILTVLAVTVGHGYIYHLVHRVAWLGTLVLAWILIRRWRDDICDAYLRRHDTGALADAVRSTRTRWYGFFVAVLAFLVLAVAALGRWARRYLLGFEQSHRLLAFLFRRRLERRQGGAGADEAVVELPEDLRARIPELPIEDPATGLEYYPGLEKFEALLTAWKDSPRIGSLLLVGGAGSGKTSWLRAAERKAEGIPTQRIALKQRMLTEKDVSATLGAALGAPEAALGSAEALAGWLRTQPRRLLILDDLEHLFLRGLDTWGAWEAFLDIVEYSAPSMFWLCALAHHPHRFVLFARGEIPVFRAVVQLAPWPEKKLGELLAGRVRESGYELSFHDLLVDEDAPDQASHAAETERDFNRLLWDYSQGVPRVALHYWLASLRPDGERRLRVRLFHGPSEDTLEDLSEIERFVLASVVWHDSLTPQEAALSLGYGRLPCEDALTKLLEVGVVDNNGGRHRVTTPWQSAVTSFLLRKHLIQP